MKLGKYCTMFYIALLILYHIKEIQYTIWFWRWLSCVFCSMFPRSTHETFAQKLYQTFKNHKRFAKPKLARSDFTICHYAGDVSMIPIYHILFVSVHRSQMLDQEAVIFFYNEYMHWDLIWFPGNLSDRILFGQEQRLCRCWTSGTLRCFDMLLCGKFISTFSRGLIQII